MEENFNNIESMDIALEDGETPKEKQINKWFIIIPIISIIVIAIIIILIILLNKDKEQDKDEGKGDGKVEDTCEIGEEDKCATCNKNICGTCNYRYNIVDGKCIANFAIRATYETKSENEEIDLLYNLYKDNIIEMEINKQNVTPSINYTFDSPGTHTVYYTLNTENLVSLQLFNQIVNLKSVYFSKEFKTQNIKSFKENFAYCEN